MPWARRSGTLPIYRTPEYRKARNALVAAFQPGDLCCLCWHPIWTKRYIEVQHAPGTTRLVGVCHGTNNICGVCGLRCNQSDAGRRAQARQVTKATNLKW